MFSALVFADLVTAVQTDLAPVISPVILLVGIVWTGRRLIGAGRQLM